MRERLDRMMVVAGLMRDHRLSRLSAAIAERDGTVALRDGLVALPGTEALTLRAHALYGAWVAQRRDALQGEILRQTGRVDAEFGLARTAFARAQALRALRDQLS